MKTGRTRGSKKPVRAVAASPPVWDGADDELDALIAQVRERRARESAERGRAPKRDARRNVLAHQAREIAQHLKRIAVILEHHPLDSEEVERYGNVLRVFDALTRSRSRLEEPPRKMAGEPFTLPELQNGWVNPLGELWASWTQIFNRTELADRREAMAAVMHTLRALRIGFWPSEATTPTPRERRASAFLGRPARSLGGISARSTRWSSSTSRR